MIRVMLVDDHASFLQPLAFMFDREPDIMVVARAESVAQARERIEELKAADSNVDLALLDLDLPDGSGTEVISILRDANPEALALILTSFSERDQLAPAIEAGAAGVMHKSVEISEIVDAARRLHAGEQLISPSEVIEAMRFIGRRRQEDYEAQRMAESLTQREREVLQALADGLGDREIADRLHVGIGTVRTHMVNILRKLDVASRLQALLFAVRHDVVTIN
ncbi:MAG TPA: response regulator transcription factor [Rubrobacteraceae bacterium]|nr:response regulator transcription factor [Rubrobacteraceae bacterium]